MGPLRIAVAGVGSFTQRVLLPGLLACPNADVVAVFGPTRDKTEKIAAERGIARAYSDYEQMLDQAKPQAVVIATPNDVHAPMALAALERGLHVFCEKPLTHTVEEARLVAQTAAKMKRVTQIRASIGSSRVPRG